MKRDVLAKTQRFHVKQACPQDSKSAACAGIWLCLMPVLVLAGGGGSGGTSGSGQGQAGTTTGGSTGAGTSTGGSSTSTGSTTTGTGASQEAGTTGTKTSSPTGMLASVLLCRPVTESDSWLTADAGLLACSPALRRSYFGADTATQTVHQHLKLCMVVCRHQWHWDSQVRPEWAPQLRWWQLRPCHVRLCGALLQLHGRSGQDL